jgi:hypothetical protein
MKSTSPYVTPQGGGSGTITANLGTSVNTLILGQSNNEGRGFMSETPTAPDARVKVLDFENTQIILAQEPLIVSFDTGEGEFGHSMHVAYGKKLLELTGRQTILIPSAKGGSASNRYLPATEAQNFDPETEYKVASSLYSNHVGNRTSDMLDNNDLFIRTLYRAKIARDFGYGHNVINLHQGESQCVEPNRVTKQASFVSDWQTVVRHLAKFYGWCPLIIGQLGPRLIGVGDTGEAADEAPYYQQIREKQRSELLAALNTDGETAWLYVCHDVPSKDGIHYDTAAYQVIGDRAAKLLAEKVYGISINGTGPQLAQISAPSSTTVKVRTEPNPNVSSAGINDHANYDGYFKVYDNGVLKTIASIARDGADVNSIIITLSSAVAGTLTVEYSPPHTRSLHTWAANVVKDADGMPLACFGPLGIGSY